jgi:hypothetical protein
MHAAKTKQIVSVRAKCCRFIVNCAGVFAFLSFSVSAFAMSLNHRPTYFLMLTVFGAIHGAFDQS